jgi:putative tryptophan/tyrosine transport system substrate-binding protein
MIWRSPSSDGFRTFQDYPRTGTGFGDTVRDADRQRGEYMPRGQLTRRYFVSCLGGAAVAWPLAARAQRPMPVIGLLDPRSPDTMTDRLRAFRQGLKDAGYVDGENVAIEYRWAEGQNDRPPALADELVRRRVAVIAAFGIVAASAAKAATTTIPILFAVAVDPVKLDLVASLARPGGNATGINFFLSELHAKRLELLRELVPAAARVAVLANPSNAVDSVPNLREVEAAAQAMRLPIRVVNAASSQEINAAFATFAHDRPDALFVVADPLFIGRRVQLTHLASRHAIPAVYATRDFPEAGGLMSYGTNVTDAWRQAGVYAGRILRARNRPICRSCSQRSSSWLSMPRQHA